jgi:hypothetical protein
MIRSHLLSITAAALAVALTSACLRGPTLSRPITQSEKDAAINVYCAEVHAFTSKLMMQEMPPTGEFLKGATKASMKAAEKVAKRLNLSVAEALLVINMAVDEHSTGDGAAAYCESR